MADQSDVENALVCLIAQTLYPEGTQDASALGVDCKVYRGWPSSRHNLDGDLKAGKLNVSVFPSPVEKNTTRYLLDSVIVKAIDVRLKLDVSDTTITVDGEPSAPANVAVLVNGKGFIYPVQASDTLASIATGLATLINTSYAATSSGAVITVPDAKKIEGRVGGFGRTIEEIEHQTKVFTITLWCPNPDLRDQAASLLKPALSNHSFIQLPDGSSARLRYERSHTDDGSQKEGLYRRDFQYSVEYATTNAQTNAQIVMQILNIKDGLDSSAPTIATINE